MAAKVLKKHDVVVQGAAEIGVSAKRPSGGETAAGKTSAGQIKAVVAEQGDDYLIVQVSCSCGGKTFIKCQYQKDTDKSEDNNTENQS